MAPSSGGGPGRPRNNIRNRHAVGAGGIGDNMEKLEMTTTPAISGEYFFENLRRSSERAYSREEGYLYGECSFPNSLVRAKDKEFDLLSLKTKS